MTTSLREALTSAGFQESRESKKSRARSYNKKFNKKGKTHQKKRSVPFRKNKDGKTIVMMSKPTQSEVAEKTSDKTDQKISEATVNTRRVYRPKMKKK